MPKQPSLLGPEVLDRSLDFGYVEEGCVNRGGKQVLPYMFNPINGKFELYGYYTRTFNQKG